MFPKIGNVDVYNEFSDDRYKGFQLAFETAVHYIYDIDYCNIKFQLLGFGIMFIKQYE